ncbi:MAG TPA: OB-fold domain-containing protein [Phenylobacterium sp.]|nr:OB-fold domain-containing protein [Phenylobacterium sp.]
MGELKPDEDFRRFLSEGRFMLQRSVETGAYVFFPRMAEPGTGAALEWVEASGKGVVHATTVVRKKPPEPSYNVALIDLEEGPRLMSRVEGVAPEDVLIGMAVLADIFVEEEGPVLVFRPQAA